MEPIRSANARAAACPQRKAFPALSWQSWALSGALMPWRRMRVSVMSTVSPSTTEARPVMGWAADKGNGTTIAMRQIREIEDG